MERYSCTTEHMWRSEGYSQEMALYFYYLSSQDQTQVMKLVNKHLCLLSHFTSPSLQVALFCFKCVHVHIHACGHQETTSIPFSGTQSTFLRESQWAPRTLVLASAILGWHQCLVSSCKWIAGDWTQVPVLARQTLYQLCHPSSPLCRFDLPFLEDCWCWATVHVFVCHSNTLCSEVPIALCSS